jgi:uncharacterized membrane protein
MSESSTGLDPKVAGVLCYLLMFVSGIFFLVVEQEDEWVRFHAYQSTATFLALAVLSWLAPFLPIIGGLAAFLVWIATVVLWIVLMVQAGRGERFELPVVGEWARTQS